MMSKYAIEDREEKSVSSHNNNPNVMTSSILLHAGI